MNAIKKWGLPILTIVSVIIAIYQTANARSTKSMYEEKCQIRCRDFVTLSKSISEDVAIACQIAEVNIRSIIENPKTETKTAQIFCQINAKIDGILSSTRHLIRFCERLNEEHFHEFGYKVYKNLDKEFERIHCFDEARFKHLSPKIKADIE